MQNALGIRSSSHKFCETLVNECAPNYVIGSIDAGSVCAYDNCPSPDLPPKLPSLCISSSYVELELLIACYTLASGRTRNYLLGLVCNLLRVSALLCQGIYEQRGFAVSKSRSILELSQLQLRRCLLISQGRVARARSRGMNFALCSHREWYSLYRERTRVGLQSGYDRQYYTEQPESRSSSEGRRGAWK